MREAFPEAGLGDDTAVFRSPGGDLLFASDAVVEGVHFRREFSTLSQVLQKVITSNVSDVFAMGGTARKILLTAGLPGGCRENDIDDIIDGLKKGCGAYDISLAGGDTVLSPGGFFFDVSIVGTVKQGQAVTRNGANIGDELVLFGGCGGSLAGLRLLEALFGLSRGVAGALESFLPGGERQRDALRGIIPHLSLSTRREDIRVLCEKAGLPDDTSDGLEMICRHIVPLAAKPEAPTLDLRTMGVTAMIDVSDGLARDLRSLCDESGTGALIHEDLLPLPHCIRGKTAVDDRTGVLLALSSGEEYSMLMAARYADTPNLPEGAVVIGEITGMEDGLIIEGRDGGWEKIRDTGYEHIFETEMEK